MIQDIKNPLLRRAVLIVAFPLAWLFIAVLQRIERAWMASKAAIDEWQYTAYSQRRLHGKDNVDLSDFHNSWVGRTR